MLSGKVIDSRFLQLSNATTPILVTPFGIVIDFKKNASSNAPSPIDVTALPILTSLICFTSISASV